MKRIFVFVSFVPLAFSGLVKFAQGKEKPGVRPPNIIFILSDDHASQAISSYGGWLKEFAQTPNIDAIGQNGVRLQNAFCTNAICGPSRASILTGKYSNKNGFYKNENGGAFDNSQWTFPIAFQQAGYTTSLFGKWHLVSEPVGFDYYKYHDDPSQQGTYWDPVFNENGKHVVEKGYATNLTTDFALDWLDKRQDTISPFLMLLQFKAPHRDWAPDSIYLNLFEDEELPYPSTFDDDYSTREQTAGNTHMTMDYFNRRDMKMQPPSELEGIAKAKWLNYGAKPGELLIPEEGMSNAEARRWKYQRYIKDYVACVKSVDDNVGKVLAYLKKHNLEENTIVVYTSDQGFFLGEHGFFDKRFMYEESSRMPLLIQYKNVIPPRTVKDDIVTNVDFAPTLLEMAGLSVPKDIQGRSFFQNLKGNTPGDWPKYYYYHYYEFPIWHHVAPHYGIRNKRYKLIHYYYNIDSWEFFDLQVDSNELKNEYSNKAYSSIINKMKKDLARMQKKIGTNMSMHELKAITAKNFGGIGTTSN